MKTLIALALTTLTLSAFAVAGTAAAGAQPDGRWGIARPGTSVTPLAVGRW